MKHNPNSRSVASIRKNLMTSGILVALLVVGFGGWAVSVELSGAVMAPGQLMVETSTKKIQHREGGIVGTINVREGQRVKAGDLLIHLDETQTRANLSIVEQQLFQLLARQTRLEAQRNHLDTMGDIPLELVENKDRADVQGWLEEEGKLFHALFALHKGQVEQYGKRVQQIEHQIEGVQTSLDASRKEFALADEQRNANESLHKRGIIHNARLTEFRRVHAQVEGRTGQLVAELARAKAEMAETELQLLSIKQDYRSKAMNELREIDMRIAELRERRIAALDQLNRMDIRSPRDGVVHQLAAHTLGGVIGAGEPIMMIVPEDETLIVEARIQPMDIDQIIVGQSANLRFSAFSQKTTPEIDGTVSHVSADLSRNPQTGEAWYTAHVQIAPEQAERLGAVTLISGMPVETFVRTGDRTPMSYLLKPLSDQLARSMREP